VSTAPFDVAVIGAGVVGAAIARALAHYRVTSVLLEASDDVGAGTSKANTAILHTGFDAKPGTLEARLVRRGYELLRAHAPTVGIPIEPVGALLVAWNETEAAALPEIAATAARNGYTATRPIASAELARLEPHLGPGARAALAVPDEHVICPFTPPLAFATEAVVNGVALRLSSPVTAVTAGPDAAHGLVTPQGTVHARWVVNAAGLHADTIDRLFGHAAFTVTPRRGELIVYDKLARPLLRHIVLPVPTAKTKGVLVAPTVFGNVVLGPTAEDVPDRGATASTAAGLAGLVEKGRRILPALVGEEVTAVYAGLRAATEHGDYQIQVHAAERYVCVGGIRSTGLTASMAIAEHVLAGLRDAGLALELREDLRRICMPNLGEAFLRPWASAERVARHPDYGRIVCHCERVTRGELLDAARAPIPAPSLDGLRRRTRALLGRCQGFFCAAEVAALLAEASGRPLEALLGLAAE
jgi:glycerol-3-phosphate dehydrogenase